MPPLISLVVPIYNRDRYLAATLHSILSQTYPHFELILWDDGSTDHSLAIAHQFAQQDARIQVIVAPHQGLTAALRSAFTRAQGEYLAWVDSDDWLAPTALAQTVDLLQSQPHVGLVYTQYLTMNEHDQILGLGARCKLPYSPKRLLVNFMTFHFRLFRRSGFDQVGGIDPACELVPDYDLCLRFSEQSRILLLPQPLYYYRIHAHSMSQQQALATIQQSQAAVNRALLRRDLAEICELRVEILPVGNSCKSRFSLHPKVTGSPTV